MKHRTTGRGATWAAIGMVGALALTGCGGAEGAPAAGGDEVNVLMVNNPQMQDLQKLTADHFTKDTGIKVNYTVLPENEVRAKIGQEFAAQAGNYDVASISTYEIPTYVKNKWLTPMDEGVADAEGFDQDDILTPMAESMTVDDKVYGEPFYGEDFVPHVPHGHLRQGRSRDAGEPDPGTKSRISPRRSTVPRRARRASACADCPAGARCSLR